MTERFIVDDAGTLIDMHTRDTFDYVSDVCLVLNKLVDENEQLKEEIKDLNDVLARYEEKELEEWWLILYMCLYYWYGA